MRLNEVHMQLRLHNFGRGWVNWGYKSTVIQKLPELFVHAYFLQFPIIIPCLQGLNGFNQFTVLIVFDHLQYLQEIKNSAQVLKIHLLTIRTDLSINQKKINNLANTGWDTFFKLILDNLQAIFAHFTLSCV